MSYFVAYVMEQGEPQDGEDVASTSGWFAWGTWVLDRHEEFPEAAHLAQEGWIDEGKPGSLESLEHELEAMMHAVTNPDIVAITGLLFAGVAARPKGTVGILVTDGEPGDEDEST